MTPDELRAAAERVRRAMAGEHPYAIYGEDDAKTQGWYDRKVLAEAYLAEHPADDAELVTAEWLIAVGGSLRSEEYQRFAFPVSHGELIVWLTEKDAAKRIAWFDTCDDATGSYIPFDGTRGQMRRLCAALGIPLKPAE